MWDEDAPYLHIYRSVHICGQITFLIFFCFAWNIQRLLLVVTQSRCRWSLSPECSSDGVCQPEASQAAEVQREAVVMGGGGDWHFGSWDTDRWCSTLYCSFSLILLLHRNLQIWSWIHEQTQCCSSWPSKIWISQSYDVSSLTCQTCLLFAILKLFQQTLCFALCMRVKRRKKRRSRRRRVERFLDWRGASRSLINRRDSERDRRRWVCLSSTSFFSPGTLEKWQKTICQSKVMQSKWLMDLNLLYIYHQLLIYH